MVGLLFASFSLAQLLFSPLWGRLSDRVGRKPLILLSLVGTALGSLTTGLASSLPLLFLGRALDGVSGASLSVAQAAVADVAPARERARLFGLLGAAFGVGFVAGPALGALAALASPRLPFLLAAALAGANALIAARRLPETRWAQIATEAETDDVPRTEAVVPPRSTVLVRLLAVAFTSLVAFSAFEATFGLFGERRLHLRLASTGAVFTAVGLALALVQSSLVRPAVRRLGEGATVRLGLLANAAGLVLLSSVHSWWPLVPALAALVVGQGLVTPSLTSLVAGGAHSGRRGGALGLQQSAGGLARVVGPAAGGLAFERLGAPSPYLAGAVLMVLCALAITGRV